MHVRFNLHAWGGWAPFPLPPSPGSSCLLQGCPAVFLPPSLPLLLDLLCISCNGFWKFCRIVFLTLCPFFLPVLHTSSMSYLSFFRKSGIKKVLAAPRGWDALGGRSSRSCLSPPAAVRPRGPYTVSLCAPALSHPTSISRSLQRGACGLAPAELPRWLQNAREAFCPWGQDLDILSHAAGSLALKSGRSG